MTLERKRHLFSIVRRALDAPVHDREALIAIECEGDGDLGREVRAMLVDTGSDMLDRSAADVATRLLMAAPEDALPDDTTIGGWRIERTLGSGGMGTVYLVERQGDGYVQRGALKLIKRGMDSNEVLARFRRERHILSRLAHPNIARMLDGGIADDGRPYLVMEYVDGELLGDWTLRTGADVDACVALVLQICDAVAHAHRQLIVHRDIKPGNVLVDTNGTPKLLDFGIAKVLADTADGARTATGQRFLSPAYAAPEQRTARGVTTASDIYQLGLLLFEMLTGKRYCDMPGARTTAATLGLLERARASSGADGPSAVVARSLRGDGGIVVARALDSEPERRYATVEAFADDLRRWRAGQPILARPDSAAYRLRRFSGRHRLAVGFAAFALVALIGGTVLALWQAGRASREAQLARSAQAFLTSVFDASAPDAAAGARVTARELLDRGVERVDADLAEQPRLRSEMLGTLGTLYRQLGQYRQAEALLARAMLSIAEDRDSADAGTTQRLLIERAVVARELAEFDKARRWLDEIVQSPSDRITHSRALAERALLLEERGAFAAALEDARAAARIDLSRADAGRADVARDRQIEALVLTRLARFDEADAAFAEAITIASAVLGEDDTRVAQIHNDYAVMQISRSRPVEGEAQARKALEARRKRLGPDHPAVAESLQLLGGALRQQGKLDDAQTALEQGLAIQRKVLGENNGDVSNSLNSLGILAATRGRIADAERYLREALTIQRAIGQGETAASATMATNLGGMLMRLGRYDEAEQLLKGALARHRELLGDRHPAIVNDENTLAQLAMRRGDLQGAEQHARQAAALADAVFSPGRDSAAIHLTLATVLLRSKQAEAALAEVRVAGVMLTEASAFEGPRGVQVTAVEADALIALGRTEEAHALAMQVMLKRTDAEPAARVGAHALLARLAVAEGRREDARRERAAAGELARTIVDIDPEMSLDITRD